MNFFLKKLEGSPDWRALHCPEYGLKIIFRIHEFNETQRVSMDEGVAPLGASVTARILREAGDWVFWHAYSEAMPTPVTEYRKMDGNSPDLLLRHKFPRLKVEVSDSCTFKQLADALRASGEYAKRLKSREDAGSDEAVTEEFAVPLTPEVAEWVKELAEDKGMSPEAVIASIVEDYMCDIDEEYYKEDEE